MIINLLGPSTDPYNSYGVLMLETARHLTRLGVQVNVFSVHEDLVRDTQDDEVQALLRQPVHPAAGTILFGYPTWWEKAAPALLRMGPQVAVTMFESTRLPPGWAYLLNGCDAVSTPSQFCAEMFKANGVKTPIAVHPLGISETYQYVERPPRKGEPFTFLTLGDHAKRKGWDVTMLAFWRAFGNDQRYRLIIKAREGGFPFEPQPPNMEVIRQDMTEAEQQALFARVDAGVFATRGEGFGWPAREWAATGLPVIATNWSGTADDLPEWGYALRISGLQPAWINDKQMRTFFPDHPHPEKLEGLGEWAEPDVEHLVEQMQHVVTGPLVRAMGRRSAQAIRRLYRWETFAEKLLETYSQAAAKYPLSDRTRRLKTKRQGEDPRMKEAV